MTKNLLPRLKINNFKAALDLPEIDRFDVETFSGYKLMLTIHEGNGRKVAVLHSYFQVYGWTENMNDAFEYKNNACLYHTDEIWHLARGHKDNFGA